MTHSTGSSGVSDPYYSGTDEAELARLQGLADPSGLGETMSDEETQEFVDVMGQIGIELRNPE